MPRDSSENANAEATARAAIDRVQGAVLEYSIGWANQDALRDIGESLQTLELTLPQGRYELGSLRGWVEILFSERKHERYGGPERVRSFVLADRMRLRQILARVEQTDEGAGTS